MTHGAGLGGIASVSGLAAGLAVVWPAVAWAQGAAPGFPAQPVGAEAALSQWDYVRSAAYSLPLATALGAALAMRPRRRGTPPRSAAVVQTQIILAVVGALVMLVVGASLARAFGVVGVAGLVRYRAKIRDPKDAGVMLITLGVGLASGVGLYLLAILATVFFLGVLWLLESFEPEAKKMFVLTIKSKDATKLQPGIEQLLRRHRVRFELRSNSPEELSFELRMPFNQKTDVLSKSIAELDPGSTLEWEEKKDKIPA